MSRKRADVASQIAEFFCGVKLRRSQSKLLANDSRILVKCGKRRHNTFSKISLA